MAALLHRWPLALPLLSATVGLALARTDVVEITLAVLLLLLFSLVFLCFGRRLAALMLLFGAIWGVADLMHDASGVAVDSSWINVEMTVTAQIEQVEQLSGYRRYRLHHIRRADGTRLSAKALLYQHGYGAGMQGEVVQAGHVIRARVRWREPRNYNNPGAFDYRSWCFDRQIGLIGSLKGRLEIINSELSWLSKARQKVRQSIALANTSIDDGGVLNALLLAERGQVSAQANRAFSATGTAHLLAISGMHIGMVAAAVFAILWFVLTRREAWIVRLPVRNCALIGGFLAAAAYATMAGWPLPAIRAAIMLAAAALAWCLAARAEPINTLLAALGLIVLFDPSAVASLSLWLSFIATAALLLWAGKLKQQEKQQESTSVGLRLTAGFKTLLWISLLATLATLPVIIASFGRIPVYTLPANMLLVPLYAVLVLPAGILAEVLALMGLDTLSLWLMQLAARGIALGLNCLTWLADLPAGELWAVHPPLWLGLLYGAGMSGSGWLLWRDKMWLATVSAACVLVAYVGFVLHESDIQKAQWIVWDVGQGSASTLLLPDQQVIVVDVPGRPGSRFNGGTTVATGLRSLGLVHVDVLALSHAQSDHLGGAISLIKNINWVGQIWLPDMPAVHAHKRVKEIVAYAEQHDIRVRWLVRGDQMILTDKSGAGSTVLNVLWPPRSYQTGNVNNSSLVLSVQLANQVRMLWPGDIEMAAEDALMRLGLENTDIILMPHHGSRSSSQIEFVQSLQPALVVAQTGMNNRYGFPKPDIVARYEAVGAEVYNTAAGALLLDWPGNKGLSDEDWSDKNCLDKNGSEESGPNVGEKVQVQQWKSAGSQRRELAIAWWKSL